MDAPGLTRGWKSAGQYRSPHVAGPVAKIGGMVAVGHVLYRRQRADTFGNESTLCEAEEVRIVALPLAVQHSLPAGELRF